MDVPGWRRVAHWGLLVLIAATLAAAAYPLVSSGRSPAGATSAACGANDQRAVCNLAVDWAVRVPLPRDQLNMITLATKDVGADLVRLLLECGPSDHGGSRPQGGNECRPVNTASPLAVRMMLIRLGFTAAVVRAATQTDPAPPGTVIFGVHVDGGCLLGFLGSISVSATWVAGPLLTGDCLPPL